jgi:phage/plasmid-associated DNA primase
VSLMALRRLMERGRFEVPNSVQRAGEAYREKLDTVDAFVAEQCAWDSSARTYRTAIYKAYRSWCEGNDRIPVTSTRFYDRIPTRFATHIEVRSGGFWHGIRLLAPAEEPAGRDKEG